MKHEKGGTILYEGFCIDLFKELAKMLRFTFKIYPFPDGQYGGITENGTWNSMMGELVDKVSSTLRDISLVRLVKAAQRVLSVVLTYIYHENVMKDLREGIV